MCHTSQKNCARVAFTFIKIPNEDKKKKKIIWGSNCSHTRGINNGPSAMGNVTWALLCGRWALGGSVRCQASNGRCLFPLGSWPANNKELAYIIGTLWQGVALILSTLGCLILIIKYIIFFIIKIIFKLITQVKYFRRHIRHNMKQFS